MLKAALFLALLASCIADGPEDAAPDEVLAAHPHDARRPQPPPIPPGPCGTACEMVPHGHCGRWQDECADAYPNDQNVTCGDQYLTCSADKHAELNTLYGQMWCYRNCMSLN